ncbi:MAG: hypothetical protein WCJ70_05075 [bacterium]
MNTNCPTCGSPLKPEETTATGKKLQRCSAGSWNPQTKQAEGCAYVKWIQDAPENLDEKCPKCGSHLIMQTTRTGKKMKKCSAGGWDKAEKKATGCAYVDWMDKPMVLEEACPDCGEKLVLQKTASGKQLKKCSTAKWDPKTKTASGCTYIQWVNDKGPRTAPSAAAKSNGDETAPEYEF